MLLQCFSYLWPSVFLYGSSIVVCCFFRISAVFFSVFCDFLFPETWGGRDRLDCRELSPFPPKEGKGREGRRAGSKEGESGRANEEGRGGGRTREMKGAAAMASERQAVASLMAAAQGAIRKVKGAGRRGRRRRGRLRGRDSLSLFLSLSFSFSCSFSHFLSLSLSTSPLFSASSTSSSHLPVSSSTSPSSSSSSSSPYLLPLLPPFLSSSQ